MTASVMDKSQREARQRSLVNPADDGVHAHQQTDRDREELMTEHSSGQHTGDSPPGGGEPGGSSRRPLRKAVVFGVGSLVGLAGVVMIFIPGPGLLVIFAGIAILATEFPWARKLMDRFKERFHDARQRMEAWKKQRQKQASPAVDHGSD